MLKLYKITITYEVFAVAKDPEDIELDSLLEYCADVEPTVLWQEKRNALGLTYSELVSDFFVDDKNRTWVLQDVDTAIKLLGDPGAWVLVNEDGELATRTGWTRDANSFAVLRFDKKTHALAKARNIWRDPPIGLGWLSCGELIIERIPSTGDTGVTSL